jgi:hypothetical protein
MSWKSFVTAGLLCVVASPVLAAPSVTIVPGGTNANGHLNAAGDWVWNVRLAQCNPAVDVDDGGPLPAGSPLGAELGFRELLGEVLTAANINDGFDFNTNPGNGIFGWEVLTDTDGDGNTHNGTPCVPAPCTVGSANADPDDEPVGVQASTALDEVFSALGSVDYLTDNDGKGYIQIVIDGPKSSSLATRLQMLGDYGGNGRIAELNDAFNPANPTGPGNPFSINHDTYAGQVERTAQDGDADLNGTTNFLDLQSLLAKYNQAGVWYEGDSTGDGTVNFLDLQALLAKYNQSYTVLVDGGIPGGGSSGAVPEPTAVVLALLGGLAFLGRRSRS